MRGRLGAADWLLEALGPCEALLRGRLRSRTANAVVYCFGQSHAIALRRAWKRGLYRAERRALHFEFLLCDNKEFPVSEVVTKSPITGADVVCPQLELAFQTHGVCAGSREVWLLSMSHTNACNVYGLFEPDPVFDFVHPEMKTLPIRPDAPLVPYEAVRRRFVQAATGLNRLFKCLPRQHVAGVIHLEGPPPNPDRHYCLKSLDQAMLRTALGHNRSVPISSPQFHMKLWRCQSEVHRQICLSNDVIYVTPPGEALDDEGYLLPMARSGATHASAWYGALALRKIERVITERRAATTQELQTGTGRT
jgi:hypothetical protein